MTAAVPHPAATVVVLRPALGGGAPEILMVRRTRNATFMADAFVFPGGRVEDDDGPRAGDALAPWRAAAARELFEEAAVRVDPATLVPFARWITPAAEPKRFDACFFLAIVPAGTAATADASEVVEPLWATAAEVLARHDAGRLKLPPPTLRTLEQLSGFASTEAIVEWAARRPLDPIQPKLVADGGEPTIVLPWDAGYAALPGEGLPIDAGSPLAEGPSRYVLRDGRFRPA